MTDTPIGDSVRTDQTPALDTPPVPASVPDVPEDRTPDQVAHDDAVPDTVPDVDPVPDDDGAAVFVAATDPAPDDAPAQVSDDVDVPTGPDTSTAVAVETFADDNVGPVASVDAPGEVLALARDTNDRIRAMQELVEGFVSDARPMLDKLGQGGISGLLGVMFGK